jgi:hypothetical protein
MNKSDTFDVAVTINQLDGLIGEIAHEKESAIVGESLVGVHMTRALQAAHNMRCHM